MKKILSLSAILILFALCVVKTFGTTVSEKHSHANSSLASEVTFDSPGTARPYSGYRLRQAPAAKPATKRAPVVQPNRRVATHVETTSTFGLDVDKGSYFLTRRLLEQGSRPSASAVRIEEFVNSLDYRPPSTQIDDTFAVGFEGSPCPWSCDDDTYLMRVTLRATEEIERKPVHLVFLVDTSGSMSSGDRLDLAKTSIRRAARSLRASDRISIVTYAGSTNVAARSISSMNRPRLEYALASLRAGGGTAMGSGMDLAYDLALAEHEPGMVSRVMVMSDGDANIGATHHSKILETIQSRVKDGISMSTFGYGTGGYNDYMMEQLANHGDGNYSYVGTEDDVEKTFGEGLDKLIYLAAKDVKVQVEFDPDRVKSWRQIGYENRGMANEDFRNDSADGGELGPGHTVTALYEVRLDDSILHVLDGDEPFALTRVRYRRPEASETREFAVGLSQRTIPSHFEEASSDHRAAVAAATFASKLRGDLNAREIPYYRIASMMLDAVDGHADRQEMVKLIDMSSTPERHVNL